MMSDHSTMCAGDPVSVSAPTELVRSITPPTDRSMPRVSTTSVCATPASTSGSVLLTVEVTSNPPGRRCCET